MMKLQKQRSVLRMKKRVRFLTKGIFEKRNLRELQCHKECSYGNGYDMYGHIFTAASSQSGQEKSFHSNQLLNAFAVEDPSQRNATKGLLYKCHHCGKELSRKDSLQRHLLIHRGELPHDCDICGKKFRDLDHLVRHRKGSHSQNLHYSCRKCGDAFSNFNAWKSHEMNHFFK